MWSPVSSRFAGDLRLDRQPRQRRTQVARAPRAIDAPSAAASSTTVTPLLAIGLHLGRRVVAHVERAAGLATSAATRPCARQRAQLGLVDLADVGHRHALDDDDRLRPGRRFVDALRGEGEQLVLGGRMRRHERGEGHRQLARIRIGRADRRAQLHRRMRGQRVLDDLGVDVVAAADDQVLGAAGEVQPALARRSSPGRRWRASRRRVKALAVSAGSRKPENRLGDLNSTMPLLARAAARDRSRRRARRARRCAAASRASGKPTQPAGAIDARRRDGRDAGHLGHAQAFVHVQAEQALEARGELGRQRGRAGAAVADRRDVGAGERHVGQRRQHRGHGGQRGRRDTSRPAASSCASTSRLRSSAGVGITTSTPAESEASDAGSTPATWNSG